MQAGKLVGIVVSVLAVSFITSRLLVGWEYLNILHALIIIAMLWMVRSTFLRGGKRIEEVSTQMVFGDIINGILLLIIVGFIMWIDCVNFTILFDGSNESIFFGVLLGSAIGLPYSAFKAILISQERLRFDLRKIKPIILIDGIIYSFFVTGFCLELFYRGFFYPALRGYLSPLIAAFITGVLDWIAHAGYFSVDKGFFTNKMVAFTLMGTIAGLLCEYVGNIFPAVFLHAWVDFLLFFYAASGTKIII